MKRIMLVLTILMSLFLPKVDYKEYSNIQEAFKDCIRIDVFKDGNKSSYNKSTKEYYAILFEFEDMLRGSREMPAFGVSLDKETREEKKKGLWIEFIFDEVNDNNGMLFESLLIKVEKDNYGFNVIRKYQNKYDGRCFYINLDNVTMEKFYLFLKDYI